MDTPQREMTFLLAGPERRLLRWTAARLPPGLMPDHLTVIGLLGALICATGYGLSPRHPGWLWLASAGLLVNWFGDSLDGTLARVRKIERPKYGYYLDHMMDAITTIIIGTGLGLSPFVALPVALVTVILYLCLSINVYLESEVHGVFDMGYSVFGPTELRIVLVLANAGLFAGVLWGGFSGPAVARVANAVCALMGVILTYALLARMRINLIRLARIEPPGPTKRATAAMAALALCVASTGLAQTPAPRPEDVSTIDGIVGAYYDVISGPAGQARDWRRDSSLYIANVRFVAMGVNPDGQPVPRVMDHGTYARGSGPFFEKNGFFEREIFRITRRFGNIVHVFSTYESRERADGPVTARGINSLQLFWDGHRWWIANATWDEERPGNPLPAEFLPPADSGHPTE
jgi:phosphatidylglycerophosphate synthase